MEGLGVKVWPSGLLDFFREHVLQTEDPQESSAMYFAYQTATVVINCLYLVNFAVNFVLYCVVNVQFRRTARDVISSAVTSSFSPYRPWRHLLRVLVAWATERNDILITSQYSMKINRDDILSFCSRTIDIWMKCVGQKTSKKQERRTEDRLLWESRRKYCQNTANKEDKHQDRNVETQEWRTEDKVESVDREEWRTAQVRATRGAS